MGVDLIVKDSDGKTVRLKVDGTWIVNGLDALSDMGYRAIYRDLGFSGGGYGPTSTDLVGESTFQLVLDNARSFYTKFIQKCKREIEDAEEEEEEEKKKEWRDALKENEELVGIVIGFLTSCIDHIRKTGLQITMTIA